MSKNRLRERGQEIDRMAWLPLAFAALMAALVRAGVVRMPLGRVQRGPPLWPREEDAGDVGLNFSSEASAQGQGAAAEARLADIGPLDVHMKGYMRAAYYAMVGVGTPPVPRALIVDTGSTDLWVRGPDLPMWNRTLQRCDHQGHEVRIVYGKGEVMGGSIKSQLCLRGACIANQTLVCADSVKDIPMDLMDGLIGLAFPLLSRSGGSTFLQNFALQENVTRMAFTVSMPSKTSGELVLGEFRDILHLLNVNALGDTDYSWMNLAKGRAGKPGYWMVYGAVGFAGGGRIVVPLVVDSGTSLIAVPSDELDVITTLVLGLHKLTSCFLSHGHRFCTCDVNINPLLIEFPTVNKSVSFQVALGKEDLFTPLSGVTSKDGRPLCLLNFLVNPGMNMWILGDTFMRRVIVVHDVTGETLFLMKQPGQTSADPGIVRMPAKTPLGGAGVALLRSSDVSWVIFSGLLGSLALLCLGLALVRRRASGHGHSDARQPLIDAGGIA